MEEMNTLSQVLGRLSQLGYSIDFNVADDRKGSSYMLLKENPENFVIDKVYRFEGKSDPEDEAVLYAVSSVDKSILGVFVDGYGTSADEAQLELICKLPNRSI